MHNAIRISVVLMGKGKKDRKRRAEELSREEIEERAQALARELFKRKPKKDE